MQYVLILHEVEDYVAWKQIFDQAAGIRKAAGERSYQVLSQENDPNQVVHFSSWTSIAAARQFFESPELIQIRRQAGVKSPEFIYLNQLEASTLWRKLMTQSPIAATSIDAILGKTIYPEPYAAKVSGRLKRKLGDHFGLTNFGVNLTHLAPGAMSGLRHCHSKQDEFIYILDGNPTLILGEEEFVLSPGECYGYRAGTGIAHHLINRSTETVTYIEIGDRSPDDEVKYPDDDLKATLQSNGEWNVTHKDNRPY